MTPAGIEPATFWFVAQHLNHCATAVLIPCYDSQIYWCHTACVFTLVCDNLNVFLSQAHTKMKDCSNICLMIRFGAGWRWARYELLYRNIMIMFWRKCSYVMKILMWSAWPGHERTLQLSHHSNLHNTQATVLHVSSSLPLSVCVSLVTKSEFPINSCKSKVYVLGAKIKNF